MLSCSAIRRRIIKLKAPDPALVAFPNDSLSSCVQVFRNAVSADDESRMVEDLASVLDKECETAYAQANFEAGRVVRNRSVDLHGFEPNRKIRDWHKMTDRVVKGIVWSPTLGEFCKDVAPIAMKYDVDAMKTEALTHDQYMDRLVEELKLFQQEEKAAFRQQQLEQNNKTTINSKDKNSQDQEMTKQGLPMPSAPKKGDILIPDTVKVVEHLLPGYEMHTEQPIVGSVFLYLNLMSPTVITFDDESSNRMGEVLLPERSLMRISGEIRWGWRWGERFDREHIFSMTRRRVRPLSRTSVQIFKYAKHLVDQRKLQETVEAGAKRIAQVDAEEKDKEEIEKIAKNEEKIKKQRDQSAATAPASNNGASNGESEDEKFARRKKEKDEEEAFAHNVLKGQGMLGGDLPTGSSAVQQAAKLGTAPHQTGATMSDKMKRFHGYTEDLGRIGTMMKNLSGQQGDQSRPISESSIHDEINKMRSTSSVADDGFIYDMEHCNMTWQQMDERSKVYKEKLQRMTYDALQDTTIEGADDEEASTTGEGLTKAAIPPQAKKKAFNVEPAHFTGKGVVGERLQQDQQKNYSSTSKAKMPSFEEAQEALVRAKAKGLSQSDLSSFGQDLDVEAFDPMKAAENISKNWIGKMKPPPGSNVPPPPSGIQ